MISGVKVYLDPTPLHYKTIPELIHKIRATIFFGTDTFLLLLTPKSASASNMKRFAM
jgi:hypothetical protein